MRKFWSVVLLFFVVACSQKEMIPNNDDFIVKITTNAREYNLNEDIEVTAELINKSHTRYLINHRSPLVSIQFFDEDGNPYIKMLYSNDIGISQIIQPGKPYNPDSETFTAGKRTMKIDKPGKFKMVGTASFDFTSGRGERKAFKLQSEPYELLVK